MNSPTAAAGTIIAPNDSPDQPKESIIVEQSHFYPMSVSGVSRHGFTGHHGLGSSAGQKDYRIEAMSYKFPKISEVPQGWTACYHPEGALYFMHDDSRTFTNVNICNEDVHRDIEHYRSFLLSELRQEIENQNLSDSLKVEEVELVLEPRIDEQGMMCCYYFVNPPTRSVFWLDTWNATEIFRDCKGELSPFDKGLIIEAQYWCVAHHWTLFPNCRKVTQKLKDEVVDMILHATCDQLTSKRPASPLNLEELKNYLAVIDRIDPEKTGGRGHCAVVIGRFMHTFYRAYLSIYES